VEVKVEEEVVAREVEAKEVDGGAGMAAEVTVGEARVEVVMVVAATGPYQEGTVVAMAAEAMGVVTAEGWEAAMVAEAREVVVGVGCCRSRRS
jgi:hypothetical protein